MSVDITVDGDAEYNSILQRMYQLYLTMNKNNNIKYIDFVKRCKTHLPYYMNSELNSTTNSTSTSIFITSVVCSLVVDDMIKNGRSKEEILEYTNTMWSSVGLDPHPEKRTI